MALSSFSIASALYPSGSAINGPVALDNRHSILEENPPLTPPHLVGGEEETTSS
jgi:hypothetical protein